MLVLASSQNLHSHHHLSTQHHCNGDCLDAAQIDPQIDPKPFAADVAVSITSTLHAKGLVNKHTSTQAPYAFAQL